MITLVKDYKPNYSFERTNENGRQVIKVWRNGLLFIKGSPEFVKGYLSKFMQRQKEKV